LTIGTVNVAVDKPKIGLLGRHIHYTYITILFTGLLTRMAGQSKNQTCLHLIFDRVYFYIKNASHCYYCWDVCLK